MTEITLTENGYNYHAEYEVLGDTLVVYLPDGSTRETILRGLAPDSAAMPHFRAFVQGISTLGDSAAQPCIPPDPRENRDVR